MLHGHGSWVVCEVAFGSHRQLGHLCMCQAWFERIFIVYSTRMKISGKDMALVHTQLQKCQAFGFFSLHDLGSMSIFLHLQLWDSKYHGPCMSLSKEMVKKDDMWLGNREKHYLFWPCRIPSRLLIRIEWHGPRLECTLNFEDHTTILTRSQLNLENASGVWCNSSLVNLRMKLDWEEVVTVCGVGGCILSMRFHPFRF